MALILSMTFPAAVGASLQANRSTVYQIRVQNTGGSDVAISAIQAFLGAAASGTLSQPVFPPGVSQTVAAGATSFFSGNVCFQAPNITGGPAATTSLFQMGATVYSNDATAPVQTVPPLTVAVSPSINWTQAQNATSPGFFDFGQPANTGLLALGIY